MPEPLSIFLSASKCIERKAPILKHAPSLICSLYTKMSSSMLRSFQVASFADPRASDISFPVCDYSHIILTTPWRYTYPSLHHPFSVSQPDHSSSSQHQVQPSSSHSSNSETPIAHVSSPSPLPKKDTQLTFVPPQPHRNATSFANNSPKPSISPFTNGKSRLIAAPLSNPHIVGG